MFNILTEEITEENAKDLYKKNFSKIKPASLAMPAYLISYYNLSKGKPVPAGFMAFFPSLKERETVNE
ncbi:hypothetical protein CE143_05195 [Photorhabdus luminescens]|uniref:Uncharacterized protein n=1 Tax=Photorhabdus akhurstii TaxID=171438 RepID=A0ABX8LU33_9GAMM|nr:hypothetical protein B0X70_05265 [Photorhabdus akhurstii]UJD74429.1 hypothetical protein CE143_05195 [Photorhabdus luminescens]